MAVAVEKSVFGQRPQAVALAPQELCCLVRVFFEIGGFAGREVVAVALRSLVKMI
jgi:hypothetical protein